jgi:hypothetical protein
MTVICLTLLTLATLALIIHSLLRNALRKCLMSEIETQSQELFTRRSIVIETS